jgi:hypothetical protein
MIDKFRAIKTQERGLSSLLQKRTIVLALRLLLPIAKRVCSRCGCLASFRFNWTALQLMNLNQRLGKRFLTHSFIL